ncbi:MAG: O-antigen ligase family protein [Alphaproteobacteria bacterium]|nr:O-antigen ligase family protein [Alphaproteobacteria bacterium]
MNRLKNINLPAFIFIYFLPLALQIQINLFRSPEHTGLRLNLADLLLPIMGIIIMWSLWHKKTIWPQWRIPHVGLWMTGLSVILMMGVLNTYYIWDVWSTWAIVNKLTGFGVLACLFYVGGWIGANMTAPHIQKFLHLFFIFFLIVATSQSVMVWLGHIDVTRLYDVVPYPIAGLMANRNAFAFLMVASFILSLSLWMSSRTRIMTWVLGGFYFLLPFLWTYNGSRAGIIIFGVILILSLFLYGRHMIRPVLIMIFGFLALTVFYAGQTFKLNVLQDNRASFLTEKPPSLSLGGIEQHAETLNMQGDSNRLKIMISALERIQQKPLIGHGLGSALLIQEEKYGASIDIIDNTSLWLLTELGVIGLGAFLIFYLLIFKTIFTGKNNTCLDHKVALLILIAFAGMSLFHEIMYTRFLWVMMGMAIVLPVTGRLAQSNALADSR